MDVITDSLYYVYGFLRAGHGLHSYGLYGYGLYSYGLYSFGLHSYGLCSYGFLRAAFNVRPTLSAVEIDGPPAAALEGASWTFVHLGADTTVAVSKGHQVITRHV